MSGKRRLLWLVVGGAVVYGALYLLLPERRSYANPFPEHHRKFRYGFETGLFLPAAYAESLVIRVFPNIYRTGPAGAQFVALDWHYPAFKIQATPHQSFDAVLPESEDILDHVFKIGFRSAGEMILPDGSRKRRKYPDCDLDRAEDFFGPNYPRPWTVSKTLARYQEASDDQTRLHLIPMLAASQDPRAALLLAGVIQSPSLELRCAAADKFATYFVGGCYPGGTEDMFGCCREWLQDNQKRLDKTCAGL